MPTVSQRENSKCLNLHHILKAASCSPTRENLVVCFGSPMIDLTVHVDQDFLLKKNLGSNGVVSSDDPSIFEEIEQQNPLVELGGSITNTCLSLQCLLDCPKSVCYIGAIGKDPHGCLIKEELLRRDIKFIYEEIPNFPTGKCAVFLNENNRSLVTDLGASQHLSVEFVSKIRDVLKQGKFFYISGYFFGVSREITEVIQTFANENEKVFVFNVGSEELCKKYAETYERIFPFVNILIGNEEEIRALGRSIKLQESELKILVKELNLLRICGQTSRDVLTVVTRGSKPVIVSDRETMFEIDVPSLKHIKRLNTNGAGDAFLAGFLAGYIRGKTMEESAIFAVDVSQKYITSRSF